MNVSCVNVSMATYRSRFSSSAVGSTGPNLLRQQTALHIFEGGNFGAAAGAGGGRCGAVHEAAHKQAPRPAIRHDYEITSTVYGLEFISSPAGPRLL